MSEETPRTVKMDDEEHALFGVVKMYVWRAGGDGDGWVICPRWRELADKFQAWEDNHPEPWFSVRIDGENRVTFADDQETITFLPEEAPLPIWAGDIVVRVH